MSGNSNSIKCYMYGCEEVFTTTEPVAAGARFICRHHPRQDQVKAVREYDPKKDEADRDVRFQSVQFDKDMKRSSKPMGTSHIQRQGEIEDTDKQREIWADIQEETKLTKELEKDRIERKFKRAKMSISEFLELLGKTPRRWILRENRIVFDGEDVCPISAVAGLLFDGQPESEAFDYQSAEKLGLSKTDAGRLIRAADNGRGELREKLLEACGLLDEGDFNDDDQEYLEEL